MMVFEVSDYESKVKIIKFHYGEFFNSIEMNLGLRASQIFRLLQVPSSTKLIKIQREVFMAVTQTGIIFTVFTYLSFFSAYNTVFLLWAGILLTSHRWSGNLWPASLARLCCRMISWYICDFAYYYVSRFRRFWGDRGGVLHLQFIERFWSDRYVLLILMEHKSSHLNFRSIVYVLKLVRCMCREDEFLCAISCTKFDIKGYR